MILLTWFLRSQIVFDSSEEKVYLSKGSLKPEIVNTTVSHNGYLHITTHNINYKCITFLN